MNTKIGICVTGLFKTGMALTHNDKTNINKGPLGGAITLSSKQVI